MSEQVPSGLSEFDQVLMQASTAQGKANLYPLMSRLREIAPAYHSANGMWYVTRYADCEALHRSGNFGVLLRQDDPRTPDSITLRYLGSFMLSTNPPEHSRLRRALSRAFAPNVINAQQETIRRIVDRLLDGFTAGQVMDIAVDYADHIPFPVISRLIGVPEQDEPMLKKLVEQLTRAMGQTGFAPMPDELLAEADRAMAAASEYMRGMVEERRTEPLPHDFISAIVHGEAAETLTEDELLASLILTYFAGLDTTRWSITNCVHTLLQHRFALERLKTDSSIADAAVEELLRHATINLYGIPRVALKTVTVADKEIPEGSFVVPLVACAHRDTGRFDKPDTLDFYRADSAHLTFGAGIHFCLGAQLARNELKIALTGLFHRFPDMEPAGSPVWNSSFPHVHTIDHLPVTL